MMENIDLRMSYRNGFNLTIDVDAPHVWHYIAIGINNERLEVKHGSAAEGSVQAPLKEMAQAEGTKPERYAAGHLSHIETLLEIPL